MWTYAQATGELQHDGEHVATGYSGHGEGKNAPELETAHSVGPIPRGAWRVEGPPVDTASHGPYVLRLAPCAGTQCYDRGGFLCHGDSRTHPGEASLGCIILPRAVRVALWESGDRALEVVSGEAQEAVA